MVWLKGSGFKGAAWKQAYKNISFLKPKSITHNFVDKTTEQNDKKVKEGEFTLCLN